ncbi:unnamed protein product [Symbiodinium sp. KB8]|nr:unnamed protein product [Symbiodinium sp. KB8]
MHRASHGEARYRLIWSKLQLDHWLETSIGRLNVELRLSLSADFSQETAGEGLQDRDGSQLLEKVEGASTNGQSDIFEDCIEPVAAESAGGLEVELAASARGLAGFAGYHTSVLIDGEEYYFSPTGIRYVKKLMSHPRRSQATRTHIGFSKATGQQMLDFLNEHFLAGSYDFLRKNCNSFTDAALYFLCETRLDFKYRAMETIGWMAESRTGILNSISSGEYRQNRSADDFDLEDVLEQIDDERPEQEVEDEPTVSCAASVPFFAPARRPSLHR